MSVSECVRDECEKEGKKKQSKKEAKKGTNAKMHGVWCARMQFAREDKKKTKKAQIILPT